MLYGPSTNSFYDPDLKDRYETSNSLPADVKEVSDQVFLAYGLSTPPTGKVRTSDGEGNPIWGDAPPPSQEKLVQLEKSWVSEELARATEELEKVQDADPKAVGSVADWRTYRKSLRAYLDENPSGVRPVSPK